jgi:hypothetical protein
VGLLTALSDELLLINFGCFNGDTSTLASVCKISLYSFRVAQERLYINIEVPDYVERMLLLVRIFVHNPELPRIVNEVRILGRSCNILLSSYVLLRSLGAEVVDQSLVHLVRLCNGNLDSVITSKISLQIRCSCKLCPVLLSLFTNLEILDIRFLARKLLLDHCPLYTFYIV